MTELTTHLKDHITGSKMSVIQEYAEVLNSYFLAPLREGDVNECIRRMDEYGITKEDLVEGLNGYSLGEGKSPYDSIPGKVKSSLTTKYANRVHMQANQFAKDEDLFSAKKSKRRKKEAPSKKEVEEEETDDVSDDEALFVV